MELDISRDRFIKRRQTNWSLDYSSRLEQNVEREKLTAFMRSCKKNKPMTDWFYCRFLIDFNPEFRDILMFPAIYVPFSNLQVIYLNYFYLSSI